MTEGPPSGEPRKTTRIPATRALLRGQLAVYKSGGQAVLIALPIWTLTRVLVSQRRHPTASTVLVFASFAVGLLVQSFWERSRRRRRVAQAAKPQARGSKGVSQLNE